MKKLWNKIKGLAKARYEAAVQYWGQRSWLNTAYQDARFDADASTRIELQRRHRYWVQNSGIVQRIRNLFIQFSVGVGGLQVIPNSSNEDWNESRKERWEAWARSPELGTLLPLSQLMIQWAGSLFDDGEIFIYKTADSAGRPMLQTIEANRVFTPLEKSDEEGKTIIDGIRLKQIPGKDGKMVIIGRPQSYFIRNGNSENGAPYDYTEVPADQIIHKFKARRPGMMRGIPEGFSVMNQLHDMDDLQQYTMQKAKAAAIVMNVITNAAGEANTQTLRRTSLNIGTQNQAGDVVQKQDPQFYDVKLGAYNQYLKTGEDMKQFRSDEPGIVTQQYWDYLLSLICDGYNVPKLLVMPFSLQGTVTRADLDICTNAFRFNFEIVAAAVREIYEWQTKWAMKYDQQQVNGQVDDWPVVEIRPPRAPNVDIGRNASALALELEIGTATYPDIFGERNQDWKQQFRSAAECAAYIKKLALEFDVEPQEIASKLQLPVNPKQADKPEESAQTA